MRLRKAVATPDLPAGPGEQPTAPSPDILVKSAPPAKPATPKTARVSVAAAFEVLERDEVPAARLRKAPQE